MLWLGVWLAVAHAVESTDEAPVDEGRERVFMPALELGVLWHADPNIRPGAVFRTSVELRLDNVRAPFVKAAYDAANARIIRRDEAGVEELEANVAFHDLLLGPGLRVGPDAVQVVGAILGGAQIAEVPELIVRDDGTPAVDTGTEVVGLATAGVGLELYFDPDSALTFDLSGRLRLAGLDGFGPLAGALTVGFTTAF